MERSFNVNWEGQFVASTRYDRDRSSFEYTVQRGIRPLEGFELVEFPLKFVNMGVTLEEVII